MTAPTARQLAIHAWMLAYQREQGAPPSLRTIGEHFAIRSTNCVSGHLRALAKKGLARRASRGWLAIDSTPPAGNDGIPWPVGHQSRPPAASPLDDVPDEIFEFGFWLACSGCHESNEGHPTGPYSPALRCNLGSGCHECGGIGAVWEQVKR